MEIQTNQIKQRALVLVQKLFPINICSPNSQLGFSFQTTKNAKNISMLKMHDTFIGEVANKVVLIFCWCRRSRQPW